MITEEFIEGLKAFAEAKTRMDELKAFQLATSSLTPTYELIGAFVFETITKLKKDNKMNLPMVVGILLANELRKGGTPLQIWGRAMEGAEEFIIHLDKKEASA